MRRILFVAALALCGLGAIAGPASAAIVVDKADDSSGGACTAADNDCSLRSAVQQANAGAGGDTITFELDFNGEVASDTITLGSQLTITKQVTIEGGDCDLSAGGKAPCVGVHGPGTSSSGLTVQDADGTTINGLAVTGAKVGIDVINNTLDFSADNDWFGAKLDGSAAGNGKGLSVGLEENGLTLTDSVLANNSGEGLDIEGADNSVIEGNYFGVAPNGTTPAANGKDIEVTDSTSGGGYTSTGTRIGDTLSSAEADSAACDGACNVIAGAATGIDLGGGMSVVGASGPTTIAGNHIGFGANGVAEVPNTGVGIQIGDADDVTVGGPSALDANHVIVGVNGIFSEDGADDVLVQNNLVGVNHDGTAVAQTPTPAGSHGILVAPFPDSIATVSDNRIAGFMDDPIEVVGSGATVTGNVIGVGTGGESLTGGITGIDMVGWRGTPVGNLVSGNRVENSLESGIELQAGALETIVGNTILASGDAGIELKQEFGVYSHDNTIGGDTAAEENFIAGSGGDAIEILGDGAGGPLGNVIGRNTGDNAGLFVDLGDDGFGNLMSGPGAGIQAPVIASLLAGSASGASQAGATVRVFSKTTPANGEISGFAGFAIADGSGNWQVTLSSPLAAGGSIGVTQTVAAGTSEMTVATLPGPGGGGAGDTDPPQTKLKKGPKRKSHKTRAKFKFGSDEPGSSFRCKLDRKPFAPCTSPKTYRHLKPGRHVFKVKATDAAGNTDSSPAKKTFKVLD